MDFLRIEGPGSLKGTIPISGAKNAALPLIAMTLLAKNDVEIRNIPDVKDIKTLLKLLEHLGATYNFSSNTATINTANSYNFV